MRPPGVLSGSMRRIGNAAITPVGLPYTCPSPRVAYPTHLGGPTRTERFISSSTRSLRAGMPSRVSSPLPSMTGLLLTLVEEDKGPEPSHLDIPSSHHPRPTNTSCHPCLQHNNLFFMVKRRHCEILTSKSSLLSIFRIATNSQVKSRRAKVGQKRTTSRASQHTSISSASLYNFSRMSAHQPLTASPPITMSHLMSVNIDTFESDKSLSRVSSHVVPPYARLRVCLIMFLSQSVHVANICVTQ